MAVLKAVILVGGPGTRLQPLTNDRPKSVLPVLNRPFMEYTFAYLRRFGIEDIILTLNYLPEIIRGYLGDGSRYGVRLTYCYEEEPMGTAGAIKNAEGYLDGTFVVLNGDIFTDLDLNDMMQLHRSKDARTTISLQWVEDPSAFGVVETDNERKILRFIEKPPLSEATTNWINAGIYIMEPEVLKYVPANEHYMVERGLFPTLLNTGEPVYGYQFRGYWLDMGTSKSYLKLNRDLLSTKATSPLFDTRTGNGVYYGPDVDLHPSAIVTGPVLVGDGCHIGMGASITGPVVIGDGCSVEDNAVIKDAIIWNNTRVGAGAGLDNCIIGSDMDVEEERQIKDCVVTSSDTARLK